VIRSGLREDNDVGLCEHIYHPTLVILIGNLGYLIQWEPFPATPTTFCSTTVRTLACPPWAAMDAASLQDRLYQIHQMGYISYILSVNICSGAARRE
jgi:hypothetical protein